jgi:hypothetical protein
LAADYSREGRRSGGLNVFGWHDLKTVMPGLDPCIHRTLALVKKMHCRVKPGNDKTTDRH